MTNIIDFKIIAHRGLLNGPSKDKENNLNLIRNNIKIYPHIINEIDIWIGKKIFIGHEMSNKFVEPKFLIEHSKNLIIHVKYIDQSAPESINYLNLLHAKCHIFCHDQDDFTITNYGWIWQHPRLGVIPNTICVMPETFTSISSVEFLSTLHLLSGVCTDFPLVLLNAHEIAF